MENKKRPRSYSDDGIVYNITQKYRKVIKDVMDQDILNDFENIQISNDNIRTSNEK